MTLCTTCGVGLIEGARFCYSCGTALEPARVEEHADHGAERRLVTVLFGDLSEFTAWAEDLDPERVGIVTDRVLASLSGTVAAFGGHVDKLTGDGIMAVFGAPTAHEDDAERAVRAAYAMQQSVLRLVADESGGGRRLGLRVGLNTGEVLAGIQAAHSYTVVGDTVNTASRLSDAARVGAIYAGRETAVETLGIASWRALAPLRLKGKRDAVPAYELVALRPRGASRLGIGDEAPLIGREPELGFLTSRWADVVERRRPASVLVAGEAGVGKTRLSRELASNIAEAADARVLVGRCAPYGEGRDLVPFVEIVRTACGIDEDDDDATAIDRVRRTVSRLEHPTYGGWAPASLADGLLGLLGLTPPGEVPRDSATPGDAGRSGDELVTALAALFVGLAAQGPILLVLDDLQWAGESLLHVAAGVATRVAGPVLLLAVGRSELIELHRKWAEELPDAALLPLAPLEGAAAERLLRAYLGGADLEADVSTLLLERAQGNPFFLAELLHLLVDQGALQREAAGWAVTDRGSLRGLPVGVHAVLAARIDSLDAGAKVVLRDAAVIGPVFWPAALTAITGLSEDEVAARLRTLVEREIVRPDDDGSFAFAHTLTREVAYGSLPKGERARHHAAVAAWAETGLPGSPAEVDPFVASHAEQAARLATEMSLGLDDPAWRAADLGFASLLRQGRAALARDENMAAQELLDRALAMADHLPASVVVPARVAHAESLSGLHHLDEAEAELALGLESAEPELRATAYVVLGDIRRKRGDEDGAVEAFVTALACASEAGSDRVAGEAIRQLGLVDYFAGRLREAEARFTEAHALALRVDDLRGQGWALQHLAWSATTRGDYALAERTLARASDVFASFDDSGGLGWCAGTEGFVRMLQGRLQDARDLAVAVLPMAEAVQDRWGIAACHTIDAMAAAELGFLDHATDRAQRSYELYSEINDSWGKELGLVALAMTERGRGELAAATARLEESVEACERGHHPTTLMLALLVLGWCHYDARDLESAEEVAHRALVLAADLGLEYHAHVAGRVLLALVARARGDYDVALSTLAEVAAAPETPTLLFPMRQALAHYAGTLAECGRGEEALEVAERALTVPAEDVRSQVVALRALGAALAACGRRTEGETALRDALTMAYATEQVSERATTEAALEALLARA